ncbi:MAG: hypothetical protein Q4G34_07585 [Micrococcus sp.]|nr:hypothetical protein [Micrococcus sp.]
MTVTRRRTTAVAALSLAGVLALSACTDQADPEETVRTAQQSMADATESSSTMRFNASEEQWREFLSAQNDASESVSMTEEEMNSTISALRDASFRTDVRSTNGQPVADELDPAHLDWAVQLNMGQTTVFDMMETGEMDYFVRLDPFKLLETYGGMGQEESEEMRAQLQMLTYQSPVFEQLFSGQWIGLDRALSQSLHDDVVAEAVESASGYSAEERQQINESILEHSDVEAQDGDRVLVKTRVKEFVEANRDLIQRQFDEEAQRERREATSVDEVLEQLNDGTFDYTYTLENDEIRRMDVNPLQVFRLIQLPDDATDEQRADYERFSQLDLPSQIDFHAELRDLNPPADATRLTEQDMNELFG